MIQIPTNYNNGSSGTVKINRPPDICPLCHHAVEPRQISSYCNKTKWNQNDALQIVYRCPKKNCDNLFIAYYASQGSACQNFDLRLVKPNNKVAAQIAETIKKISPNYSKIFEQSSIAEQEGLEDICGVGYRKALEFLIKDYLIKNNPAEEEAIKSEFLGNCINNRITNENIKSIAERATWLGNDETHYMRIWDNKDLSDLKKLIEVTVYWIEMEILTSETISEMPKKS